MRFARPLGRSDLNHYPLSDLAPSVMWVRPGPRLGFSTARWSTFSGESEMLDKSQGSCRLTPLENVP
jgi:hypothetical protein